MATKSITVRILGDASNLIGELDRTEGKLGKFAGSMAGVGVAVAGVAVAAGAALFKIGSDFDSASDTIRTATGKTGEDLAALEQSFDNVISSVPANFEDASAAIGDLSSKLGLTGKPLEDRAAQFLNLSRITGEDLATGMDAGVTALQNFGVATEDQGRALDQLFQVSQSTGVGFSDLAGEMASGGVILRGFGFGFDDAAGFLGGLNKAGLDSGPILAGLKKGLVNAAKAGEEPIDTFQRVAEGIKAAGSDAEATGLAVELFGAKAGPEMAAAIRSGTVALGDLSGELSGDTINKAAADTADFAEQWTLFKNQVLVALKPLALAVFGAVGTAMEELGPKIRPVIDGFIELVGFLQENQPVLIGVLAALAVGFGVWAAAAAAAAAATLAAIAPVIAIAVAIGVLVAGVIWAYQNWDWFRNSVDAVAGFLTGTLIPAIVDVVGWFVDMGGKAADLATDIYDMVESIVGFIVGMPGRIDRAASGMFDGIKEAFKSAINWVIGKWNDLEFTIDGPGPLGSFSLGTPNIPKLHTGGVVPGRPGEEVFALLLAGERVLPPGQSAAGIVIENLYVTERPLLEELAELEARYGVLV